MNNEERDLLNKYLDTVNETEQKTGEAFSKAVLQLSSGALGLSVTLSSNRWMPCASLVKVSWGFFVAAIFLTVFAGPIKIKGLHYQVDLAEKYFSDSNQPYPDIRSNPYYRALGLMSIAAGTAFFVGVVLMAISLGGIVNG